MRNNKRKINRKRTFPRKPSGEKWISSAGPGRGRGSHRPTRRCLGAGFITRGYPPLSRLPARARGRDRPPLLPAPESRPPAPLSRGRERAPFPAPRGGNCPESVNFPSRGSGGGSALLPPRFGSFPSAAFPREGLNIPPPSLFASGYWCYFPGCPDGEGAGFCQAAAGF